MRDGSLSYERFCAEAELLQKRSHELASKQAVGSDKFVATWEWRHGNRQHLDGNSYLVSTGNSRQFCPDSGSVKTTMELDGDIDELLVHDEDNWPDVDEPQTMMLLHSGEVETALLEFHIVFHTIYQTPVLYFRALAVDGTPLNTNTVTCGVQFPGSNGRPAFVGMEEHPVVGKPFSFLHPCETAAAMQLLQAQLQSSKSTEVSSGVEIPQYLASWLSLVQPLTENPQMGREEAAARPRKKQRVGAIPPLATASTRARFAFGSRLLDTGTNLVKSNGKKKLRISTRSSHEHDVRSTVNHRKRRRPTSQDEDEATSDAKSSHRKLTVKTALPRQSSYLPAPTKVSALLSSSNIHTKSPSNGTFRLKNQESTKQGEVVADMATTESEFWITRRKMMETALKELDAIEYVYVIAIVMCCPIAYWLLVMPPCS